MSNDGEFGWSELRQHWEKSAAQEASDPMRQPTEPERLALDATTMGYRKLLALGWKEPRHAPTNKTVRMICAGSSGITLGTIEHGRAWAQEAGDLWPVTALLWKEAESSAITTVDGASQGQGNTSA